MQQTPTRYPRSHEPIAWSLFGAGGMVVAFITPALIVLTTLLIPLGLIEPSLLSFNTVLAFMNTVWGALGLWIVITLQLFHAAHRIYHGLHDLHVPGKNLLMLMIFYGGASALSFYTGYLLITVMSL